MTRRPGAPGAPGDDGDGGDADDDLDRCDGYVLLVADPVSAEVDCYGPYTAADGARAHAARLRDELDDGHLDDVVVVLARWHRPENAP